MIADSAAVVKSEAAAWAARAGDLAAWAWRVLVNRTDAWGGYWRLDQPDGTHGKAKQWTKPRESQRGLRFLEGDDLARHFRGQCLADLVGLHTTSPANRCRWGVIDIDHHGPDSPDPALNERAALGWWQRLGALGLGPLLLDSDGKGGYHLWVVFAQPVPSWRVYWLLHNLTAGFAACGLTAAPEHFPKQPFLQKIPYGNWVRLPGRHHTKPHWTKVFDGGAWQAGDAAIDLLLATEGVSPELIPDALASPPPAKTPARRRPSHRLSSQSSDKGIAAYLAKVPHLAEGQGRHRNAYTAAAFLLRDKGLSEEQALPWLIDWDLGNCPPLGEDELRKQMACALKYGQHPIAGGVA